MLIRGLGQAPNAQQTAASVTSSFGPMSTATQQQIEDVLGQNFDQSDVQTAVSAYNQFGPSAVAGVKALASGNVLGAMEAATPLIAAGIAATGIGAPVAGAIMGGLTIFEGIANTLGLSSNPPPAPSCHWTLPSAEFGDGSFTCFNGPRPYGPKDPKWITIEQFVPGTVTWNSDKSIQWQSFSPNNTPVPTGVNYPAGRFAFEPWWDLLTADMNALGVAIPGSIENPSGSTISGYYTPTFGDLINMSGYSSNIAPPNPPPNLKNFVSAFEQAVLRSWEYPINNWTLANPLAILTASVAAWNAGHSSEYTYTFNGSGKTLIDAFIRGDNNQQDWTPVTVNIGMTPITVAPNPPVSAQITHSSPTTAISLTTTSSTSIVLATAAVITTLSAAAILGFSHANNMTFVQGTKHLWSSVTNKLTRKTKYRR